MFKHLFGSVLIGPYPGTAYNQGDSYNYSLEALVFYHCDYDRDGPS